MIAKLTGILDRAGRDHAVIDVGGVGYLVRCSSRTLAGLSGADAPVSLAIVTMVREDAIELYGFAEETERDWFRLLLTVQGVGAKVAMALLSALAPDQLANALASGDKAMLTRADGVVFLHTGGAPNLFTQAETLGPALRALNEAQNAVLHATP